MALFAVAITIAMTLCILTVLTAEGETEKETVSVDGVRYELDTESHTATVIGLADEHPEEIEIKETVSDCSVTKINDGTFDPGITGIVIPDSVETIGDYLFGDDSHWSRLTSVQFGENSKLKSLGAAFYNCRYLTHIELPSGIETIGNKTFYKTGITSIKFPASVETLGDYLFGDRYSESGLTSAEFEENSELKSLGATFYYCTKLEKIELPGKIKNIGDKAFYKTGITSIKFPASVETLGNYLFGEYSESGLTSAEFEENSELKSLGATFYYCTKLEKIELPGKIKNIGDEAFYKTGITSITFPASVETLGDRLFGQIYYPSKLNSVNFEENSQLKSLGATFCGCTELTEIKLPDGITTIGNETFWGTGITSITLPSKVEKIGNKVFLGTGITKITFPASVTTLGDNLFSQENEKSVLTSAEFEKGSNLKFLGATFNYCYNLKQIELPSGVETIGDGAFNYCYNLKQIELPSGVKTIGDGAFNYCYNLKQIELPSGVKTIGDGAFGNTGISSITFPASVETLGNYLFSSWSLTSVQFGENSKLKFLGATFANCGNLKQIELPSGIITIGDETFYKTSITEITIPASVETLGSDLFGDWRAKGNLKTIHFKEDSNLRSLSGTFYNCGDLTEIKLPSGVKTIGNETFCRTGITSIKFPASVETLGDYLFGDGYFESGLTSAEFEENSELKSLGATFYYCTKLEKIELPGKIKNIGDKAFYETGITSIEFPASVETLGDYLFGDKYFESGLTSAEFKENSELKSLGATFYNCTILEKIELPGKIKNIGDRAFGNTGISSITFPASVETLGDYIFCIKVELWESIIPNEKLNEVTFAPGSNLKELGATYFGCKNLKQIPIPDRVTTIGNQAFVGTGITSITFPASVETLGDKLFSRQKEDGSNTTLEKVTFAPGSNLKELGATFYQCARLTEIKLPDKVKTIGNEAFVGTSISSITFPDSVETLGDKLFGNDEEGNQNSNLTAVDFGDNCNLETIGAAFYQCAGLTEIKLPDKVKTVGDKAFFGTGITSIEFPESVETIGNDLFAEWSDNANSTLTSVTFGEGYSLKTLGAAFHYCTALNNVTIPKGVTEIPYRAFKGCSALNSIALGNVRTIGAEAFDSCGLTSITIPTTVIEIRYYAFANCPNLTSIEIPHSNKEIVEAGVNIMRSCPKVMKIVIGKGAVFSSGWTNNPFSEWDFYDEVSSWWSLDTGSDSLAGYTFTNTESNKKKMVKTFNLETEVNGEIRSKIPYQAGARIEEPEAPPDQGKTFYCWADGSKQFDFDNSVMPGNDFVLRAAFEVTVTYVDENGTVYDSRGVGEGLMTTLPGQDDKIRKDGHALVGWRIDGAGEYAIGETCLIETNTNVIAKWYEGTDIVVFTAGGNKLNGNAYELLSDGKAKLDTGVETESGSYFFGWCYTDENGDEFYYAQGLHIRASGTVYLTPYIGTSEWTPYIYYNYGSGTGTVDSQQAESGKKIMLPTSDDVECEGHKLKGWEADGTPIAALYYETPSGWWYGTTITAIWEEVSTATFKDTDGSILKQIETFPGNTIELYSGDDISAQGSALVGWKTGGSDTILGLGTDYRIDSDVVFSAARIDASDVLVYATSGGKMIGDTYSLIEGGSAVSDTRIEKNGYIFLGWLMTDSDGNTVAYPNGMHIAASGVVRLDAYLVPEDAKVHKVAYDFNEGIGSVTVQEAEEGQLIALQTSLDVRREGYKLTGWEVSPATTVAGPYYEVTSEDAVMTAVWESIEPGPSPEPPIWDDDDDDPYIPTPAYDSGSSGGSNKTRENAVAVAVAAAAAAVTAILAIAVFRRK